MDVTAIVIAASIPSALTGFCFWLIEQRIQKRAKKREDEENERREAEEKRERLREQQELLLVQGVGAAIALGEATAKAVQRIPDAHCNGDMHAALDYAAKVKHAQKDFLTRQGIEALYD
ncbi:serine/threonine protein kinase [bacterium D16-50]|nr:serine/threonine protein kinase [bacterium D16-50]